MLNSVEWKYFKLEDLFEIEASKDIPNKEAETNPGEIPYITTKKGNNGVKSWTSIGPFYQGNKITIAGSGQIFSTYYQSKPFTTSQRLYILTPNYNKFNVYHGIFISYLITLNKNKYSYGRQAKMSDIKSTSIKLPVDSKGNPNWDFMEDYMKQLSKGNLDGFTLPKNDVRLSLDDREWDDFRLEDLFEIETGKDLIIKNIKIGDIPVISHSSVNNGVSIRSKFIKNRKLYNCEKSITLADRGTFYATVQAEDYYLGTRVKSLISKSDDSSIYSLIFISTIINQEKYRYNYGRNATHRLPDTIIKLPIKPKSSPDENSEPDWEFMEDYIKGLPYTNKL